MEPRDVSGAVLEAFLAAERRAPFVWGESDCTLFAANWARAVGGRDPGARWRGRYADAAGAAAEVDAAGGMMALGAALGWPLREGFAQPGDVALVALRLPERAPEAWRAERFAVCAGPGRWAVKLHPAGLAVVGAARCEIREVWACPR